METVLLTDSNSETYFSQRLSEATLLDFFVTTSIGNKDCIPGTHH